MENAATRMVRGEDSIRHHVRRKIRHCVMVNPAPHTRFLTVPEPAPKKAVLSLHGLRGYVVHRTAFCGGMNSLPEPLPAIRPNIVTRRTLGHDRIPLQSDIASLV